MRPRWDYWNCTRPAVVHRSAKRSPHMMMFPITEDPKMKKLSAKSARVRDSYLLMLRTLLASIP